MREWLVPGATCAKPFFKTMVLGIVLLLPSCEGGEASSSGMRRDSAGISIFTLHGEDRAPLADFDGDTSVPLEFANDSVFVHGVVGGLRLSNGQIAVGSRHTSQVLLYDTLGNGFGVLGRAGGGPGEFSHLASIARIGGDTIAAFDAQYRRVSVFALGTGLIRDYTIAEPDRSLRQGRSGVIGHLGRGRLLFWTMVVFDGLPPAIPNQGNQLPILVFSNDAMGRTTSTASVFIGEEQYISISPSGQEGNHGRAPFGRWTRFGIHNGHVFAFGNAESSFAAYSADGQLQSIYRASWPVREITEVDRQRVIEEWVRLWPREDEWDMWRKRFRPMKLQATMPAYANAIMGTDGIAWLEPYHTSDWKRHLYIGYDSTGLAVGKLILGLKDRILEIGSGQILFVRTLEDGTESVRLGRYRF